MTEQRLNVRDAYPRQSIQSGLWSPIFRILRSTGMASRPRDPSATKNRECVLAAEWT